MKPESNKFTFISVYRPVTMESVESAVGDIISQINRTAPPKFTVTVERVERTKTVKRSWFFGGKNRTKTVDDSFFRYVVELENPTDEEWWAFHGACIGFGQGKWYGRKLVLDLAFELKSRIDKRSKM